MPSRPPASVDPATADSSPADHHPSRHDRPARPGRRGRWRRGRLLAPVVAAALALSALAVPAAAAGAGETAPDGSPVAAHGQLGVRDGLLLDAHDRPVQLRGMSSHGLQYFPEFVNVDAMRWLHQDWGVTVFRAAMYTENGGYVDDPAAATATMRQAVEAAVELGLYVVVDWHVLYEGDPNAHRDEAVEFFTTMARDYGHLPNVIWEIANEPNGEDVTWSGQVKPYAEEVIAAIRAHDPDNPVIVGSSTWSQDIHLAAADPLADEQVLYALHFYAGTHGEYLRERIDEVLAAGQAVLVSEWGVSEASGTGGVFVDETREWTEFLDDRMISWINWNLSDKDETSAVLVPGADPRGGWSTDDLSPAGVLVRELVDADRGADGYGTDRLARVTSTWVQDEATGQRLDRSLDRAAAHPGRADSQLEVYRRVLQRAADQGLVDPTRADTLLRLSEAAGRS